MKFIYSVAILSGTIIGAGIFALPYLTTQVGFFNMFLYLVVFGGVAILIHSFFGDLSKRTPDFLRLPGFAELHLGPWAKKVTLFSGFFGLMGAVLAYIILGGSFLYGLLSPIFGGEELIYTLVYFSIGAIFVYFGVKAIEKISLLGVFGFVIALIFIFVKGWSSVEVGNITNYIGFDGGVSDLFLPYGVVLFAFWGAALIPEMEELLSGQKKKLNKAIILGIALPLVLYTFFIVLVVGITGGGTTEESIIGLQETLTNGVISAALLFGILVTFTSFIALALTLKKILWYDLKIPEKLSWAITMFIPLILFLCGIKSYINVIGTIGAVFLAIDAILITIMYQKYKSKKHRFITYPLIFVFALGIVYQFFYFFI